MIVDTVGVVARDEVWGAMRYVTNNTRNMMGPTAWTATWVTAWVATWSVTMEATKDAVRDVVIWAMAGTWEDV